MNTLMRDSDIEGSRAPLPLCLGPKDPRHIVWVNEHAAYVGGCEHYIARTARLLSAFGVRNTLLYQVDGQLENAFLENFQGAFPLVDPQQQLRDIDPDVGFVHRLDDLHAVHSLTGASIPCVRFYHDHKLFCLREHKYTLIGQQSCERRTGLGCYGCLGFLQRSDQWPGVQLRSLSDLEHQQDANLGWDGHLVGSNYMADHLQLHGFDPSRIHVAPLFVEPPRSLPMQRQENLIVFVGQLVRGKGLDSLLKAIAELPNEIVLKVAGEGRQRQEFESLSNQLGVQDRVEFMGKQKSAVVERLYRKATVVAMPSRTPETFGLSGLEASSCGAAVVATNVGGISQWLRHEVNGLLCEPNDPRDLADCLRRVLKSKTLQRQMGEAGEKLCRQDFAPQRHLVRLMKLFRNCLQGAMT